MNKVFTLFLWIIGYYLPAQTVSFDITIFGNTIGRMEVTKSQDNEGNETYLLISKSKAKVLWIVREGFSKFEATYKNGKLFSCSHFEMENNKIKRFTKVKFDGKLYQVESLNMPVRTFSEFPECSDLSLYFRDNKDLKRLFYLPDASFYNLTQLDANSLEFKSSDGHRNVYFFENGKIKTMEFHLALATVYMKRIN